MPEGAKGAGTSAGGVRPKGDALSPGLHPPMGFCQLQTQSRGQASEEGSVGQLQKQKKERLSRGHGLLYVRRSGFRVYSAVFDK